MPKIATLLAMAFTVFSLTACDDIREEKYPNGKVRSRVQYVENAKQGVETEFYENGKVKRTRNF